MSRAKLTSVALTFAAAAGCSTLFPEPSKIPASADASVASDGSLGVDTAGDASSALDAATTLDAAADGADGTGCQVGTCPLPTAQCQQTACVAGACGFEPASGGSCDDGDLCTANDRCEAGVCSPGVPRNWLSLFGNGNGGRLSAVLAGAGGSVWAAGSNLATKGASSYDAWLIRADRDGRLVQEVALGVEGSDDLVALTATVDGGMAAVGYGGKTGRIVRLNGQGALTWSKDASELDARYDDIAAIAPARLAAVGMTSVSTKNGDALVDAFESSGALAWTFKRNVGGKRVAAAKVAAFGPKSATSGDAVVLGYDRTLPPGGSGADLYEMWLIALDAKGAQVWLAPLSESITAAASGLVARDDGTFVVMLDVNSEVQLSTVDGKGKVSALVSLPGGSINTASDLIPGPAGGLFVVRDNYKGDVELFWLDANGQTLSKRSLSTPTKTRARNFGAYWLGGTALALSGDLMLQMNSASATSFRAFVRRFDIGPGDGCSPVDACLGNSHVCPTSAPCQSAYCDGVSGCQTVALNPTACAP